MISILSSESSTKRKSECKWMWENVEEMKKYEQYILMPFLKNLQLMTLPPSSTTLKVFVPTKKPRTIDPLCATIDSSFFVFLMPPCTMLAARVSNKALYWPLTTIKQLTYTLHHSPDPFHPFPQVPGRQKHQRDEDRIGRDLSKLAHQNPHFSSVPWYRKPRLDVVTRWECLSRLAPKKAPPF